MKETDAKKIFIFALFIWGGVSFVFPILHSWMDKAEITQGERIFFLVLGLLLGVFFYFFSTRFANMAKNAIEDASRGAVHLKENEQQLRQLAVFNDVFANLVLEATPRGMLQRLLEGASYITKAEFGVVAYHFPDGDKGVAQVGVDLTPEEAEKVFERLTVVCQKAMLASSKVRICQDAETAAPLSPPLPPIGSMRAMALYMGDKKIGFLLLCHSGRQFDFMKGESAFTQLVVQAGLLAEKFDLFRQVEKKSKDIEEANRHLAKLLAEFEEKNRQLDEANQAIKRSKAELESFVYTASHDLKAPVVSLHGMASMLLEDYHEKLDEEGRHYLQRLMANADFMERLIADLLQFSRVGRREQRLEQLQTEAIVQDVLKQCYDMIGRRQVKVRVHAPLPEVRFDSTLLKQVFLNLIGNGVKFMGDQANPTLEIGGREGEGFVEFYVRDNGIGIDPQSHDQIFGVFQRLKEIEVDGTGVGLAIVKKIIQLGNGTIWVESKKGDGATFSFRLPREKSLLATQNQSLRQG